MLTFLQHFVNASTIIYAATVAHTFLDAVSPIADALGAALIEPAELSDADLPLWWEGRLVGGLRRPDLHYALDHLIKAVEKELGTTCSAMSRNQKQRAVAILNDWGAFALRKSVEDVAEALAVSRFTIYNYLERAESAS